MTNNVKKSAPKFPTFLAKIRASEFPTFLAKTLHVWTLLVRYVARHFVNIFVPSIVIVGTYLASCQWRVLATISRVNVANQGLEISLKLRAPEFQTFAFKNDKKRPKKWRKKSSDGKTERGTEMRFDLLSSKSDAITHFGVV